MENVDYKKIMKNLYQPSDREVAEVEVPAMNFLMVDGEGDLKPLIFYSNTVQVLFSVSFAIKFMVRRGPQAVDYRVMPLEGLWWADGISKFTTADKSKWKWTMMIMQPSFVTNELMEAGIAEVAERKNPATLPKMRLEAYAEGRCAQVMHIGHFSEEKQTVEKLHQFIESRGSMTGKHHEIYLSDIRKVDPAKWKTIIRQPMR